MANTICPLTKELCRKEACAWWYIKHTEEGATRGNCCIPALACTLAGTETYLKHIRNLMNSVDR